MIVIIHRRFLSMPLYVYMKLILCTHVRAHILMAYAYDLSSAYIISKM